MRRVRIKNNSKRAFTLVEVIVAMTLTMLFATACVILILPVSRIYKHTNDLSRAQLLADTVVDSLRNECTGSYIMAEGDVWISNGGADGMTDSDVNHVASGPVLVIRRNRTYCETIAANYELSVACRNDIYANSDETHLTDDNAVTSRSIYRLIVGDEATLTPTPTPTPPPTGIVPRNELSDGIVHFGYFELDTNSDDYVYPSKRYDFTNPFGYATYRDFHVALTFSDITSNSDDVPVYCKCKVDILNINDEVVYSREVVLCFS